MSRVLVATRSAHKLGEIRQILAGYAALEPIDLREAGIPEGPDEDSIEAFDSFEENAMAKARYFAARSELPVLADDSGLCVDALGGEPGVRSRRFSGRTDLAGAALDGANNALLLERLEGVPEAERTARYVCAVALVLPGGEERVFLGTCEGIILPEPRGEGGFGYDPLFWAPGENAAIGELPPERKNELSHRGKAVRAAGGWLASQLDKERFSS
ncbi:MAG TPA: RdgB/HAM1 family non-canonical purine NTP pyrophosphatase [Longimicrobiaceae bacterium]|nr:RdgB/HAM1 family non-canonical purine NTP pyrophosphatase [Longimicrobiaceae bacterium]